MMKTTKYLLLTGLLAITTTVFAQQERQRRGAQQQEGEPRREFKMNLDLTEDQEAKFEELRLSAQKSILPLNNELGENRAKMRTLTTSENPDLKAINKLIDETSKVEASIAKIRAANHQELRKTLTEEQRIKFDSRAQMRKGEQGMHRRGQRGNGQTFKGQSRK